MAADVGVMKRRDRVPRRSRRRAGIPKAWLGFGKRCVAGPFVRGMPNVTVHDTGGSLVALAQRVNVTARSRGIRHGGRCRAGAVTAGKAGGGFGIVFA